VIRDVSNFDVAGFVVWIATTFAVAMTATLDITHTARALPESQDLSSQYLIWWAERYGGALLALSILAGLILFWRATPWEVVLSWPWLAGPAVGLAFFLSLTPYMDGGTRMCDAPMGGSCDTAWGIGAALVSIAAGVALGGPCVALVSGRRLLGRIRRGRH
jgi:hypothetical protein